MLGSTRLRGEFDELMLLRHLLTISGARRDSFTTTLATSLQFRWGTTICSAD